MKKQIYRVMSGLCAAMLLVPTLALTAFAVDPVATYANTPVVVGGTVASRPGVQDVFYYAPTAMPTANDITTIISGFEPAIDWLVVVPPAAPAGITVTGETVTDPGKIFLKDATNTQIQILTVSGVDASPFAISSRIIGTTTPILRGIVGEPKESVEKGNSVTLTANVSTYDGKAAPATVKWSDGTTATGNAITVDTTALAVGEYTYTATVGTVGTVGTESKTAKIKVIACPATLSGFTVKSSEGNSVDVKDVLDITFTATPTFTGKCTLPSGAAHDKDVTASWSVGGTVPAGVSMIGNILSIKGELPAGTHPITVTATSAANTAIKDEYSLSLNKNAVCDAAVTGVTITNLPADGKLTLNINQQGTVQPMASYAIAATTCTIVGHDVNHGLKPSVTWSLETPIEGVTIDATIGLVTVGTAVPNNTQVKVKATLNGVVARNVPSSATQNFSIARNAACGQVPSGVAITPVTAVLDLGAAATTTQQYAATITFAGTPCSLPAHTNDPNHGLKLIWTVTNKDAQTAPAFAIIDQNGLLTVTASTMPSILQEITVTATIGEQSKSQNVSIQKNQIYTCTKVLNSAAGSIGTVTPSAVTPTTSKLIYERNRTVLAAVDPTVKLALSLGNGRPAFVGECGYEKAGVPCVNTNHKVMWSIAGTPLGITINTTNGELTVLRDTLGAVQTQVNITASVNGAATPVGYIVVNKGSYSSSSSGSGDDDRDYEEERRQEQYNKIENQILDADRKDTIKATLTDNYKFPTRIMRELKGQDVNLELYMGNGFTWNVNGKNLKTIPKYQIYISLDITNVKDSDISDKAKDHDIKIFELGHEGDMFGTYNLKMDAGDSYAKKTVYLYKHLDKSSKLSYKGAAKVDSDGYVIFPFTSASTYVLTDRALYGETANTVPSGGGNTGTGGTGSTGGNTGGTTTPITPPASVAPTAPPSSSSSEISSESASEISSESSDEPSKPADVEPEEEEKPEKKKSKIPIIVPILIVVVTITVVAVVLLAKGGGLNVD